MKIITLALLILSIQSYSMADSSANTYDQARSRFQSNIGNTRNMKYFWDEIIYRTFRAAKNSDLIKMVKEWDPMESTRTYSDPSDTGAVKLISHDDSITAKLSPSQVPTGSIGKVGAGYLLCHLHRWAIGTDTKNASSSSNGFSFTLKFENKTNISKSIYYFCSTTSCGENDYEVIYNCFSEKGDDLITTSLPTAYGDDW